MQPTWRRVVRKRVDQLLSGPIRGRKTRDAAMVIMERVYGARARFNDFIGIADRSSRYRAKAWTCCVAGTGMFLTLTGAALSHAASGDPVGKILAPLVVLGAV